MSYRGWLGVPISIIILLYLFSTFYSANNGAAFVNDVIADESSAVIGAIEC